MAQKGPTVAKNTEALPAVVDDKHGIVGQAELVSNIERILKIFQKSAGEIKPHFFLTGESGNSKSFTIRTLAQVYKFGFIQVNAAQLTKEGTSGNSLSKALTPLMQMGSRLTIVFVDEFDKLFISGNSNDSLAHETTTGVQNEFLATLENDTTQVYGEYGKYMNASVKNVLFIFAGAFNGETDLTLDRLRELGIKTEFLGRVGIVFHTNKLQLDHLYKILEGSELLAKYLQLFENVNRADVLRTIRDFIKDNYEMNTLGARMVNTLIHQYFIHGGKLKKEMVDESTFQERLKL